MSIHGTMFAETLDEHQVWDCK